jgi:glycyl-tRNA synthetase beta chain
MVRGFERTHKVIPELFESGSEEVLWRTFQEVRDKAKREIDEENYFEALNEMATLAPVIDELFSHVMVMAEDKKIRENRLELLSQLQDVFLQVADLSKLSV